MHDFTPEKYRQLIKSLSVGHAAYNVMHDVDLRPAYALRIARIESEQHLHATYFFRVRHFDSHCATIKAIASLGHAVGYHYESLTTCNGDIDAAYSDFCRNLERLRSLAPVETACAHGSPRSPWNSQDIWKQYDIHALGISYEPMLDTDFSRTLYLTDTGRRWDGYRVSVRDKVPGWQEQWEREGLSFHSTDDIIHALRQVEHPIHSKALLLNTHPQRWMPVGMAWMAEAGMQWGKNIAKRLVVLNQNH